MRIRLGFIAGVVLSWSLSSLVLADDACRVQEVEPLPGDDMVFVTGLNNWGQVIGWSFTGSGLHRGFVWQAGRTRALPPLEPGAHAMPSGINDLGQVVGMAGEAGTFVPTLWWLGRATRIAGQPGDRPFDINNRGQLVGTRGDACIYWPSLRSEPVVIPSFGGSFCSAQAINERGEVVGFSTDASGVLHGFWWRDGSLVDVGMPEFPYGPVAAAETALLDINDRGLAVGFALSEFGFDLLTFRRGEPARVQSTFAQGIASALNEWGTIVAFVGNPHQLRVLGPSGTFTDLGSMRGNVNGYGLYLNELHQVAWYTNELNGYFCQLRAR